MTRPHRAGQRPSRLLLLVAVPLLGFILGLNAIEHYFEAQWHDTVPIRPTNAAGPHSGEIPPPTVAMTTTTTNAPSSAVTITTAPAYLLVEDPASPVLPRIWSSIADPNRVQTTVVKCLHNGMQAKCHFRHLALFRNEFIACGPLIPDQSFPNPIYLPDGQQGPMIQYHQYRGHRVAIRDSCRCRHLVARPTVFLFRMSGHSTYHLWENNLGPFYATLNEFSSLPALNLKDPKKLLVAFADFKPTKGPKAPHLLDQLLRTFSDLPLINATRVQDDHEAPVCFQDAILGTSANSFPHMDLLHTMMRNIVGYAPPPPLPVQPNCLFVSRNHPTVVRGRKIANQAEVVAALNRTIMAETGKPLRLVFMEDLSYKEQVALAMTTNIWFSPHGGGVANCIWMAKGSVLVEFVAPVGKTLLGMYRSMCGKSGVKQVTFLADPDPDDEHNPAVAPNPRLFSNMVVPPERIVDAAKTALKHYREAVQRNKK